MGETEEQPGQKSQTVIVKMKVNLQYSLNAYCMLDASCCLLTLLGAQDTECN